jgi:hemerythrin-like domain-containing protein
MNMTKRHRRRDFLGKAAALGCGLGLPVIGAVTVVGRSAQEPTGEKEEEVTPTEDLMREHGVLSRVLLIYEEAARRLIGQRELPPEVLADSAGIIRTFIENYHEKNEENYLFPRFEKAGKLVDLVKVLRTQHEAGRRLTESIQELSTLAAFKNAGERSRVTTAIHKFIRMYRPHKAREDTVLFPALRSVVSAHEFAALGEQFEDKEHELLGANGFENMVDKVAGLEKKMGIYNLVQLTPS